MSVPISERDRERIAQTVAVIPGDARTGLEIGFADFRVTEALAPRLDLVSVDLPRAVPARSDLRLVFADIEHLPFRREAVDVVVGTEVLEHLEPHLLERAASEMARVARRYILVSVPYRQRVWNERFKCRSCGYIGHSMGHLSYLDDGSLRRLFPTLGVVGSWLVGRHIGYAPDWLYRLANVAGNVWADYSATGPCPKCHLTDRAVRPNVFGLVLQRIIWRLERWAPVRPAWILMLFGAGD